jgi:hypothetical protein
MVDGLYNEKLKDYKIEEQEEERTLLKKRIFHDKTLESNKSKRMKKLNFIEHGTFLK